VTAKRRLLNDLVEQENDHHRPASQEPNAQLQSPALQYPNGGLKTGSAQNADYGAEFNLGR
jgi:hypothetical protein